MPGLHSWPIRSALHCLFICFLSRKADNDVQQDDIIINGPLLAQVFRRQLRSWLWKGLLLFGLLLLLALCLVPRTYTSIASVAIQQSSSSGSALALLSGGGANKRYIGILKSHQIAAQVERHVHLQQLYGLPTEDDAVNRLMKSVKPDDNTTDGLLYINVTLPGQPKISLKPRYSEAQVKTAAAQVANGYALALKEYYLTSDTDQGSELLRGADKEVRKARADYDDAFARAVTFNRGLRGVDPRSAPRAEQSGPELGTAADNDRSLYVAGSGTSRDQSRSSGPSNSGCPDDSADPRSLPGSIR